MLFFRDAGRGILDRIELLIDAMLSRQTPVTAAFDVNTTEDAVSDCRRPANIAGSAPACGVGMDALDRPSAATIEPP